MRARDGATVMAVRSALAAIANAEALPPADRPSSAAAIGSGLDVGVGATEMPRRDLSDTEIAEIIRAEATDRHAAAEEYAHLGRPDEAIRLRAEATVLLHILGG